MCSSDLHSRCNLGGIKTMSIENVVPAAPPVPLPDVPTPSRGRPHLLDPQRLFQRLALSFGLVTSRFSHPTEIADLVLFLASDRAANITGANVAIDGGLITTI